MELSADDVRPVRLLVHWLNVPLIIGHPLTVILDKSVHHFAGRWCIELAGLVITMDARPGLTDSAKGSNIEHIYMFTHVMEIRRRDGAVLDLAETDRVLECLRTALSFGFGRWIAPAIRVGLDQNDNIVWESWGSPICDPFRSPNDGWLCEGRLQDVTELATKAVATFNAAGEPDITRFQFIFGVEASRCAGFVEQRLLSAFSAIENLEWALLVLGGRVSARDYKDGKKWSGVARLRRVLSLTQVDQTIDAAALPALAHFAKTEKLKDGPEAIVRVRNRLVHPKRLHNEVYHVSGLMMDAWLLARYYAVLLVLYSIDYRGSCQKLLPPWGWWGEVHPVPWS